MNTNINYGNDSKKDDILKDNNQNFINKIKNDNNNQYTKQIIQQAGSDIKKGWLDKLNCNISFLQQYFDIETDDIKKRLIDSLKPLNREFIQEIVDKPDLYGPFWIYTTLVFVIAVSGSLTKYLHNDESKDYFQEFIPLAACVIYGIGFCLPLVITILMKFFESKISFVTVLCVYAYSFTIYIPVMILCIPFEVLQWILLFYAVASSTGFLLLNFWEELAKYSDNNKYFILGVILIFQICLFIVLKVNFFARISNKMNKI